MAPSPSKRGSAKKGEDGLTKYQRYYQKNSAQIRMKNKQREKEKREAKRREKDLESSSVNGLDAGDSPQTANLTPPNLTDKSTAYRIAAIESMGSSMPDFFAWMDPDLLVGTRMENDPNSMTRPPDFFKMMPWLREQEYHAAVDKVVGPRPMEEIARPQMFDELEQLYRIRENVIHWSSGWCGSANWSRELDRSFIGAVEGGRVEHWRKQVYSHATWGRGLLAQLEIFDHRLPMEHWKVRELWRLRLELAEVLIRGVTILDMKNSILPGLSTVRYTDLESAKESDEDSVEYNDDSVDGSDSEDQQVDATSWGMYTEADLWDDNSGVEYTASDDDTWEV